MKIGVAIPNCGEGLVYRAPFTTPQGLIEISKEAEALGYDSVWANDHLTTQRYVKEYLPEPPNYYEPLITLSTIALCTRKIKIATGVLALPMRNPIIVAKQVSTLDAFSNGRVILGVGLGAYREEFEAVKTEYKHHKRALILDEYIRAIKVLFSEKSASFEGRYVRFENVEMYPKPIQSKLPIFIGGNSENVIKRVAKLGDGWVPAILSPSELREKLDKLKKYACIFKRRVDKIEIAPQFIVSISKDFREALKVFHISRVYKHLESLRTSTLKEQFSGTWEERNLIGSPSDIIKRMEQYVEIGVEHFAALVFLGETQKDLIKNMRVFAEEVLPSFK